MGVTIWDHAGLFAGGGLAAVFLWYWTRPSIPLPPGPKGSLIFGSALEFRNSSALWLDFAKYSKQYGPIITIRMLDQKIIIIDDPKIVADLFEKRAAQYSDRRVSQLAKIAGWDRDIIFVHYGSTLKHYRALLHRALNNRVVLDYLPLQEHEVKRLMKRLWERPEQFMRHIHLMAGSVAIRVVYGYKLNSHDDPFLQNAEEYVRIMTDLLTPGRWIVDVFPFLRYIPAWFPGAAFRRAIAAWDPYVRANRDQPFDFVKQQLAAGVAEPSFVSKLLEPENSGEVSAEEQMYIKILAASLFGAASDTTVSVVKSFFLAITLYPDVQAKAQTEIAAYIQKQKESNSTSDQPPLAFPFITMADRPSLPYTNALVRELLRWHPVVTLVLHRSCEKDDNNVVVGEKTYRIPACTTVLVNTWSILHNPAIYTDPERFLPERYLVENPPPIPEAYAFGFGRRVCPGTHVAQQSMWLSISNILANFTITKAKDENGVEIIPPERYTAEVISHPVPFNCSIQLREGCGAWLSKVEN